MTLRLDIRISKQIAEGIIERCYWENVFQKYAANLQKNNHAKVRFQYFLKIPQDGCF